MHYSATTGGFYDNLESYPSLPDDLVEITDAEHQALMDAQGQGKVIAADAEGKPVANDRVLSDAELASQTRNKRDRKMDAFQWRIQRYEREVRLGQTPTDNVADLDAYMQALADVPDQAGFPHDITWPVEP